MCPVLSVRICRHLYALLVLSALPAMPLLAQPLAHVHGEALLTAALDASRLEVALDIPADSLWGFEYAPKTRAEQDKIATVKTRLVDSASVLQIPVAAQCVQRNVNWQDNLPHHADHEHTVKERHSDNDDHQNIVITYQFDCARAEQLNQFDVTLFSNFSAVQHVRVQWVDRTRQLEKELDSSSITFSFE